MASFIVEDGTGLSNSNAFVSVDVADAYIADYSNSAVWSALDDTTKQQHIRLGARYLEAVYRNRIPGRAVSGTQRMLLPRTGAYDNEGFLLANNAVWQPFEEANALAALKSAEGTINWGTDSAPASLKKKSITIGDIEIQKEWVTGEANNPVFEDIRGVLSKIIISGNELERA